MQGMHEEGHEASFTLLFTDSVMTILLCLVRSQHNPTCSSSLYC